MKMMLLAVTALILTSIAPLELHSQIEGDRMTEEQRERIESMRVAYITRTLDLSSEQAQQFWPLYNEMQKELRANREKVADTEDSPMELTEEEAEKKLDAWINQLEAEVNILKSYQSRFDEILDKRQVLALYQAENQFKRQMLRRVRNRRHMQSPEERNQHQLERQEERKQLRERRQDRQR